MEPPTFTPAEIAGLVCEAVAWKQQQRDKYHPASHPRSEAIRVEFRPFFSAEILDYLRIKDISKTGGTIPHPPSYERVRDGGARRAGCDADDGESFPRCGVFQPSTDVANGVPHACTRRAICRRWNRENDEWLFLNFE